MMRHAESEERLQSIRDHDRPITEEGRSSAREVAFPPPCPVAAPAKKPKLPYFFYGGHYHYVAQCTLHHPLNLVGTLLAHNILMFCTPQSSSEATSA